MPAMETDLLCKIMEASFRGASELIFKAAADMSLAATAATEGNRDLARGTAIGVEADLKRAMELIAAISAFTRMERI